MDLVKNVNVFLATLSVDTEKHTKCWKAYLCYVGLLHDWFVSTFSQLNL